MAKRNDIAVVGIGKFGQAVVSQLIKLKKPVLAVDIKEEKLTKVSRVTKTLVADASDPEALKHIGLGDFKTIVVGCNDNIEIVATLIEMKVKHIIAKAKSESHERVLRQIGVDVIVRPEYETGIRTALIATNDNFIKFSETLNEVGDGYAIGSTIVTDDKFIGKPLKDLKMNKMGISVISIKNKEKIHIPSGETVIEKGDTIMMIGKIDVITTIFGKLSDETKTMEIKMSKINKAFSTTELKLK